MKKTQVKTDFLVVGAGKSGTSWLHVCLDEHPEVFVPPEKEIHYFSYHYDRGATWYNEVFADRKQETCIGECSPTYLWHPDAASRIFSEQPDAKLLFILRRPIERAYSHYCMHQAVDRVTTSADETLVPGSEYVETGKYDYHLCRFAEFFPPEQMKVLFYEDLQNNPRKLLKDVFDFIGVDPDFQPSRAETVFFARKPKKQFPAAHRLLVNIAHQFVRRSPKCARMVNTLRESRLTNLYHRMNSSGQATPLSAAAERVLAEYFREDTEALSRRCDKDLSHWLEPIAPETQTG